jgi:hypothetical protein
VRTRHLVPVGQLVLVAVVIALVAWTAQERTRQDVLTAFHNYRPDWDDAWRAPVEHRAVDALGRLLATPDRDPEMAEAALAVMRRSPSWFAMGPEVGNQLKGWLDARLDPKHAAFTGDGDALRPAYDLLVLAEAEDADLYRQRIAALAGDRSERAAALTAASAELQDHLADAQADAALARLDLAWTVLGEPLAGAPFNHLARAAPPVAPAEKLASLAVVSHIRHLLEPYGLKALGTYGETRPDQAMLDWLDRQAREVERSSPGQRDRLQQAREVLARHLPDYRYEPVVDIACRTALRRHAIPGGGLLIAALVLATLGGGLAYALARLARGPLPVDVNAETMENVEPIDLDTDAETRGGRSSASITDVG